MIFYSPPKTREANTTRRKPNIAAKQYHSPQANRVGVVSLGTQCHRVRTFSHSFRRSEAKTKNAVSVSLPRPVQSMVPMPGIVIFFFAWGISCMITSSIVSKCALGIGQRSWAEYITEKSYSFSRRKLLQSSSKETEGVIPYNSRLATVSPDRRIFVFLSSNKILPGV